MNLSRTLLDWLIGDVENPETASLFFKVVWGVDSFSPLEFFMTIQD